MNPNKEVADYRTEITGVSAADLFGVTCTLADIQVLWLSIWFQGIYPIIHLDFSPQFMVHIVEILEEVVVRWNYFSGTQFVQ